MKTVAPGCAGGCLPSPGDRDCRYWSHVPVSHHDRVSVRGSPGFEYACPDLIAAGLHRGLVYALLRVWGPGGGHRTSGPPAHGVPWRRCGFTGRADGRAPGWAVWETCAGIRTTTPSGRRAGSRSGPRTGSGGLPTRRPPRPSGCSGSRRRLRGRRGSNGNGRPKPGRCATGGGNRAKPSTPRPGGRAPPATRTRRCGCGPAADAVPAWKRRRFGEGRIA